MTSFMNRTETCHVHNGLYFKFNFKWALNKKNPVFTLCISFLKSYKLHIRMLVDYSRPSFDLCKPQKVVAAGPLDYC